MISVAHLATRDSRRIEYNHATYKQLYEQCAAHIRRVHASGTHETVWNVPAFVLGRSPYDVTHAVRYVRDKLQRGGFDVHVCGTTVLQIQWHAQIRKQLHRLVAAKPKAPPTPKKKVEKRAVRESLERLKIKYGAS